MWRSWQTRSYERWEPRPKADRQAPTLRRALLRPRTVPSSKPMVDRRLERIGHSVERVPRHSLTGVTPQLGHEVIVVEQLFDRGSERRGVPLRDDETGHTVL